MYYMYRQASDVGGRCVQARCPHFSAQPCVECNVVLHVHVHDNNTDVVMTSYEYYVCLC